MSAIEVLKAMRTKSPISGDDFRKAFVALADVLTEFENRISKLEKDISILKEKVDK
jgi:hypothetical protein